MTKRDRLKILAVTDEPMQLFTISQESHLLEFVESIERIIRNSQEYRNFVTWLKLKNKQTVCEALKIDVRDIDNVRIEMHHHPLTLWDITYIVGRKMISESTEDYITMHQIADRVIKEHMVNQSIGIVPLTVTYHQLYHAGEYKIKEKEFVFGNYEDFIERYKEHIPEEIMNRINERIEYLD